MLRSVSPITTQPRTIAGEEAGFVAFGGEPA
jgi:hypothetical protein